MAEDRKQPGWRAGGRVSLSGGQASTNVGSLRRLPADRGCEVFKRPGNGRQAFSLEPPQFDTHEV